MSFYYPEKDSILVEVLGAYDFPATLLGAARFRVGFRGDLRKVLPRFPG